MGKSPKSRGWRSFPSVIKRSLRDESTELRQRGRDRNRNQVAGALAASVVSGCCPPRCCRRFSSHAARATSSRVRFPNFSHLSLITFKHVSLNSKSAFQVLPLAYQISDLPHRRISHTLRTKRVARCFFSLHSPCPVCPFSS